jgi:hypothetical protein
MNKMNRTERNSNWIESNDKLIVSLI